MYTNELDRAWDVWLHGKYKIYKIVNLIPEIKIIKNEANVFFKFKNQFIIIKKIDFTYEEID